MRQGQKRHRGSSILFETLGEASWHSWGHWTSLQNDSHREELRPLPVAKEESRLPANTCRWATSGADPHPPWNRQVTGVLANILTATSGETPEQVSPSYTKDAWPTGVSQNTFLFFNTTRFWGNLLWSNRRLNKEGNPFVRTNWTTRKQNNKFSVISPL